MKNPRKYSQRILVKVIKEWERSILPVDEDTEPYKTDVKPSDVLRAVDILNKMNGNYNNDGDDKDIVIKLDLT